MQCLRDIFTDDKAATQRFPESRSFQERSGGCAVRSGLRVCDGDASPVIAPQSLAAVVLQKSLREGFGLTVTEAMWKGTPVIGGNVGGIRHQIKDGENGYLVDSVEEAAERIVTLVRDQRLRDEMGERARETVRDRFLMIRMIEDHLDLCNSFETVYRYKN